MGKAATSNYDAIGNDFVIPKLQTAQSNPVTGSTGQSE